MRSGNAGPLWECGGCAGNRNWKEGMFWDQGWLECKLSARSWKTSGSSKPEAHSRTKCFSELTWHGAPLYKTMFFPGECEEETRGEGLQQPRRVMNG